MNVGGLRTCVLAGHGGHIGLQNAGATIIATGFSTFTVTTVTPVTSVVTLGEVEDG